MAGMKLAARVSGKLHVMRRDKRGALDGYTQCGMIIPEPDDHCAARLADDDERCQRPGCRQQWPAALSLVS